MTAAVRRPGGNEIRASSHMVIPLTMRFGLQMSLAARFRSSASSASLACWQRASSSSECSRRICYFEPSHSQGEVKGMNSMVPPRGTAGQAFRFGKFHCSRTGRRLWMVADMRHLAKWPRWHIYLLARRPVALLCGACCSERVPQFRQLQHYT